jgi:hypothetical protein
MKDVFIVLIFLVLSFAGVAFLANIPVKNACNKISVVTGKETQYHFSGGCFVKLSSGWVPINNWNTSEK